jgi:hypothetical protein
MDNLAKVILQLVVGHKYFGKVLRNTDGAKVVDVRAWGSQNESGGIMQCSTMDH